MTILEELISPLSFKEFHENYFCHAPLAAPFKASRFCNLLSWPLLEEILKTGHGDCWLPRQGRLPSDPELAKGTLTIEQAYKGFSEGRTVLVRHAERAQPKLQEIAKDFATLFPGLVDVQLYYTPAGEEGFDWHYDIEDVFVLQSRGEKEFRLRPEPSRCEIRCLLKAGDWLYIPSGYWHKARAETLSFHISVGVRSSLQQNTSA